MAFIQKSELTFFLAITVYFAIYADYSAAQCLKKDHQKARCQNIVDEFYNLSKLIKQLKQCLKAECIKISLSSSKACEKPSSKTIPGFNPHVIPKNISVESFLQEILKRMVTHQIHDHELIKHFKSGKCSKETKLVKIKIRLMKSWISSTQKELGFSTVAQTSKPPKLSSTGAKTQKDWYDVQQQMLTNLTSNIRDMQYYFRSHTMDIKCIIPVC